jgi:acyl-coenzyme A thioesterase PaaI-like protein
MTLPNVVAGTGVQTIDQNGLLQDQVAFTVQYVPPGSAGTSITAEALVLVPGLNFTDALIGQTAFGNVQAIIDATYANLQNAAGSSSTGTTGAAPKAPPPGPNPSGA